MRMSYSDQLDWIENNYNVVIEVSDESGCMHVYTYTERHNVRLGFDFYNMHPEIRLVSDVARSIAVLRTIHDTEPRVGELSALK